MTEAEAKTKMCPFTSNRSGHPRSDEVIPCMASGCMKWRWTPGKSPKELEERKHWPLIPNTNVVEPTGYCG